VPEGEAESLTLEQKESRALARLKKRAEEWSRRKKRGQCKWNPVISEVVLVENNCVSDSNQGVTQKFMWPYEGPFWITKIVLLSIFEITNDKGRVKGIFNKRSLINSELRSHLTLPEDEGKMPAGQ
jgi:hypothetical protein